MGVSRTWNLLRIFSGGELVGFYLADVSVAVWAVSEARVRQVGALEVRYSLALVAVGGAFLTVGALVAAIVSGGVGKNGSTVAVRHFIVPPTISPCRRPLSRITDLAWSHYRAPKLKCQSDSYKNIGILPHLSSKHILYHSQRESYKYQTKEQRNICHYIKIFLFVF